MWGNILFLQSWLSILSEHMYYFSVKICTKQVTGLISLLREKTLEQRMKYSKCLVINQMVQTKVIT